MMKRLFLFLLYLVFSTSLYASSPKCLFVSIERYEHEKALYFVNNDISKLSTLLQTRHHVTADACIDKGPGYDPSEVGGAKRSIEKKIGDWCDGLGENDTAILYLAGHGIPGDDGKLYLPMIDFSLKDKNYDTAAIPLQWIRDRFGNSKAKHKMILIDTCFSGISKNITIDRLSSGEMSKPFAEMKNIVTVASCGENEKSWLWPEQRHSLFTYWLIEAFKGHADLDNDRTITCNEFARYLKDNVSVAAKDMGKSQHPVVLNSDAGTDIRFALHGIDLVDLFNDMAQQIDLQMRMRNVDLLGVPEFTCGEDRQFDPRYGILPARAASRLSEAIARTIVRNRSRYDILDANPLRELLQSQDISTTDWATNRTKNLKIETTEIPVIVNASMTLSGTNHLAVRANLLDLKTGRRFGNFGGVAVLRPAELTELGISGTYSDKQEPDDFGTPSYVVVEGAGLVSQQMQGAADEVRNRQRRPHPMNDPKAPFKVWFETRPVGSAGSYLKKELRFDGNHCYLPLSKGEEYRFGIENTSDELVFVRALVDGRNTLSQQRPYKSKDLKIEACDPKDGETIVAPRVGLEEARAWVFGPKIRDTIDGFYDINMKGDKLRRFRIVDADKSLAARKNYTDQIGLITIGFFKGVPKGARGGIVTDTGPPEAIKPIPRYKGDLVPGTLWSVYNIRYLTPEKLEEMEKNRKK